MSGDLERFDPAEQRGRIAYEHLHRYALCREFVAGKRVLDLACGTGYGTAILGSSGAMVTGVDISAQAIELARRRHACDNVEYLIANCFDLPFEAGTFDVIVANEMIEHVTDHDRLLQEARRVLKKGGLLLVSTPNKPVYNRFKTPNPFHVLEMDVPEFQRLLDRHFCHVHLTGIRMSLLSASYPLEAKFAGNLGAARILVGNVAGEGHFQIGAGELPLTDPEYVLAACSDSPVDIPELTSSIFFNPNDDLWPQHESIMAWASGLHEEDEALRAEVTRTREELARERSQLLGLRTEQERQAQSLADLRRTSTELGAAVQREREALMREGEGQRALLARLLSEASDHEIGQDQASIIAGLFALNTRLVEERLKRDVAEDMAAQRENAAAKAVAGLEEATTALAAAQADRDAALDETRRLRADLADRDAALVVAARHQTELQADIETLQAQHDATSDERDRALAEVKAVQHKLAEQDRDLERAAGAQTAAQAQIEVLQTQRDTALAQYQELLDKSSSAKAELDDRDKALAAATSRQVELQARLYALEAECDSVAIERDRALCDLKNALMKGAEPGVVQASALEHEPVPSQSAPPTCAASRLARPPAAVPEVAGDEQVPPKKPVTVQAAQAQAQAALDGEHTATRALAVLPRRITSELTGVIGQMAQHIGPKLAVPKRVVLHAVRGRKTTPVTKIFLAPWLERQMAGAGKLSLHAYLTERRWHRVEPHPLFAAADYLAHYPDVAAADMSPLLHYVEHGWREGRNPHPLFANDWYLAQNPDVAADGSWNPLDHYLQHGWREGRWPNPLFNPRAYLDRYPDVAAAETEPLTHFLMYGKDEGRELPASRGKSEWSSPAAGSAVARAPKTTSPAVPKPDDAMPAPWPPRPLDDFWPTQAMRDFILDGYGEEVLNRSWYLLSLMQRWHGRETEFAGSDDCRQLVDRLCERARLHTSAPDQPGDATVIIPVYNNLLDTLICLASLLELDEAYSFDIIVADDGSSDATAPLIGKIGGRVRHLRQTRNLGFLGNCNAAAKQARGRYVVLLNNDTLVMPGWLDGLLSPFAQFERVGLVGSKLINWDGTLQEAGGIVWRDGSAWNLGRNQDARAPEYNYLKDVDYCSGASIAVPTALWQAMDGFDTVYAPAYCEDSDLAFRLREQGYRTLYSPASEVVHHEGRSHGRDLTSGGKAYQVANNERFFKRWQRVLEQDHYPNAQNVLRARDRSSAKRHILVVDHYVPQWDKDAGSRTIYAFMRVLIEAGHRVTFWPDNLWRDPDYTPKLQQLGIEVVHGPGFVGKFSRFLAERADLYDMVLLSRPHIAQHYIDAVRELTKARVVYYGHDIHFRRMMAQRALQGRPVNDAEVAEMKRLELSVCNRSDLVLYPSRDEAEAMGVLLEPGVAARAIAAYRFVADELAAARAKVHERTAGAGPLRLLFVGGFGHPPNSDAITWFCQDVLPLIDAAKLATHLKIVGSKVGPEVNALQRPGVEVLGFVSDEQLGKLYDEADLVIAPLRYGAGVKGKVIEAMARGVPVVTTDTGAQGIENAGQLLFIGNTAEAFAAAVLAAAQADAARERALASLDFISAHYSTQAMRDVLESGLRACSGNPVTRIT